MAAGRVGTRGGVVRPGFGEVRRSAVRANINTVNAPSPRSQAAHAWGILSRSLDQVSHDAGERWNTEVANAATDQGVMDAINGSVRRLDRSTTRGAAYMDAAVSTMSTIMETNALVHLTELYRENPNNPAAVQQGAEDYSIGVTGRLAEVSPAAAVQLQARMVTQAIPMINGAVANREAHMARVTKEAREQAEAIEQGIIAQNAPHMFDPDPGQSAAANRALMAARANVTSFQSEEAAEAMLLQRLSNGHDASHIVNMQGPLKVRLSSLIAAAPPDIQEGLGIGSGFRSIERQRELFNASDRSGRRVARPGHSQHNHGNAADLTFNGKFLGEAPQNVQDWVHENAAAHGLKFPMDYEPWHVEVQETRGGAPFVGTNTPATAGTQQDIDPGGAIPSDDLFGAHDQDFYDEAIGSGFLAHFEASTNKVQTYLDFMAGETRLTTYLPDGTPVEVDVRERLSETRRAQIEDQLRGRMNFENTLADRAEADAKAAAEARSATTRAGVFTGILLNGQELTDPISGEKFTATMPTADALFQAHAAGDLNTTDYEVLLKALTVERPVQSNEDVKREALRMTMAGVDPTAFLMDNLNQITTTDARTLMDDYKARAEGATQLTDRQNDYYKQLQEVMDQTSQIYAGLGRDDLQMDRKHAAENEFRRRALEGEDPEALYQELVERARLTDSSTRRGLMTEGSLLPRFAVPSPDRPGQIDVLATLTALEAKKAAGEISDAEYNRQIILLETWQRLQDQEPAAPAEAQ